MTISVQAPNGSTVEFPDGTTADAITAVMAKNFGGPKTQPASGGESMLEGIGRGLATGVPVIGGLLNRADAATNAALAPMLNRFFPQNEQLQGGFGQRYKQALRTQQGLDTSFGQAHPLLQTGAELGGGIAALGGLGSTELGAKALGLGAKTLPAAVGQGALGSAALGGADAFTRGGNPLIGAAIGGVAGAAAPLLGAAGQMAANRVARAARGVYNPLAEATRRVGSALGRDVEAGRGGLTAQQFGEARAAGQPVNLMDLGGENTRALARSSANVSPEARSTFEKALDSRYQTQSNRLSNWLKSKYNFPDALSQKAALDATAKATNDTAYKAAMAEGDKPIWSPELERLAGSDSVVRAMRVAIKNAKDEGILSGYGGMRAPHISFTEDGRLQFSSKRGGPPTYPNLQFWDLVRRELSSMASEAKPGSTAARRYGAFARDLNAELDRVAPSYADARQGAAKFFGAQNALEAGQKAVGSSMSNPQLRLAISKMSPQEKKLFQDGFVERYTQKIEGTGDQRNVAGTLANSPADREKLAIILGQSHANELQAMLHVEQVMNAARSAVKGNSTTARQLMELGLAGGVDIYESKGKLTDPKALMKGLLAYGILRGSRAADEQVASKIAELLTSSDGQQLSKGIKLLSNDKGAMQALGKLANILRLGATSQATEAEQSAPPLNIYGGK